jgi:hypothetical protein
MLVIVKVNEKKLNVKIFCNTFWIFERNIYPFIIENLLSVGNNAK